MRPTAFLGLALMGLAGCGGNATESTTQGTGGTAGSGGTTSASTGGTTTSHGGTGGTTTGTGGAGGTPTTTGTGGTGAGGTTTTGTDCGPCDWSCCGTTCTNLTNDIHNCGACGKECPGPNPFCDNGTCGEPPCNGQMCGPAGLCCGAACCQPGELCCDIPGPVESGPKCTVPTEAGTCPLGCQSCVCASPDTPVATPDGERPIADLQPGDLVYSVHGGQIAAVPIAEAVHVPAPDHVVVHVTLANGRTLDMSPSHPTADGRTFGELRAGDSLQGEAIASVRAEPFRFAETVDILPASDSGAYFAAGALVGSTLAPGAPQHCGAPAPPAALKTP